MRISATVVAAASVLGLASAQSFNKDIPWGKRDYPCINVYQGIPENSTLSPGLKFSLKWNREATTHCTDVTYLNQSPTGNWSIVLYNNPVRNLDTISFEQTLVIQRGISANSTSFDFTVPMVPPVKDDTLWYLRLDTDLQSNQPQPSLFNAAGPFAIRPSKWV